MILPLSIMAIMSDSGSEDICSIQVATTKKYNAGLVQRLECTPSKPDMTVRFCYPALKLQHWYNGIMSPCQGEDGSPTLLCCSRSKGRALG